MRTLVMIPILALAACVSPTRRADLAAQRLFWLDNATRQHGFDDTECAIACGTTKPLSDKALAKLRAQLGPNARPSGPASGMRVLPYPGGRHPRRAFRERAIDPNRGTKASVFAPWTEGGYVVVDLPEAIWWLPPPEPVKVDKKPKKDRAAEASAKNAKEPKATPDFPVVGEQPGQDPAPGSAELPDSALPDSALLEHEPPEPELLFLAHRDLPTRWERLRIRLDQPDWTRHLDGSLTNRWRLPNGIEFEASVSAPFDDGVDLSLTVLNGSDQVIQGLRSQVCVMLAGCPEFATKASAPGRRATDRGAVAVPSQDGQRQFAVVWQHGRVDGNDLCPCVHSDPSFPDLDPGQSATRRGRVQFHDGPDANEAIRRARVALARAGRAIGLPPR